MSLKCRVCGKELPEFDQRGFRNAGFTAHQNRCIERERERREGITKRRPQRAHTTHGHRRLLPASSSSSLPPFIDYYRRSSQRRRRHSTISDVVSLQQSSAPASFFSSPPSFSSQPLAPSTFLNFNTASPEEQQQQQEEERQALQSQSPPPPLFSSFPISHYPNYYVYRSYCSQPPPSSITVSSSAPPGSTYPPPIPCRTIEQITGSSFLHPIDHDPIQQDQSPSSFVSSSSSTTLSPLPSQQQMQPSSMVNSMNPILPHEAEEEKPFNYSSLSAPPDLQFHGVEQESSIITTPAKLQVELFPVRHCDYCIPNAGLHDPNCYLLRQFVTGATTRAPQGPSSSASC